jgi:tetratricopeptide (TPR) repeat protein/transcriptional regulator with XRE-family HTH domain
MFGGIVVAHRRRLGLTQEGLAERAGLSVRTIRMLESGRTRAPRQGSVRLLAEAFGLDGAEREKFFRVSRDLMVPVTDGQPVGGQWHQAPAQLPADVAGFTGRHAEIAQLDELLAVAGSGGARMAVVSGTAGVGKTSLVVRWAYRVAGQFPGGQLYVNMRGYDPGGQVVEPGAAVRGFLHALGVPAERVPAELDAQAALYRSLLAGAQTLVVLDNARDAEQVRPLLPGNPAVAVVTSRNVLTSLVAGVGARPVNLEVLSAGEAGDLLAARLGVARVAAEPDAVAQITVACAGLPLALCIAAARAQHTGFALSALAADLGAAERRLDALDAGDSASQVRAVFSWSYAALTRPAAELFRLLGLHPGPDISLPAAASLAAVTAARARALIAELSRASLLTEHTPGRFTYHDLLRTYARELVHAQDTAGVRRSATTRLLDHYLHSAYAANQQMYRNRAPMGVPLAPAVSGALWSTPANLGEALAWFADEQRVLLNTVGHAAGAGFDRQAWQLAWALSTFLRRQGCRHDEALIWHTAFESARRIGEPAAQAYAHRRRGVAHTDCGRFADGETDLRVAGALYEQIGDLVGQLEVHQNLINNYWRRDDIPQALECAERMLAMCRHTGEHPRLQARALDAVGLLSALQGDYPRALELCGEALVLFRRAGDVFGEATIWDSLGWVHDAHDHHNNAAECYNRALTGYRRVGDRHHEAAALNRLGDSYAAAGDLATARDVRQLARDILADLDRSALAERDQP